MSSSVRPLPPALPHGGLRELFPGIFFLTGTVSMPGPLPVTFSRAMTVIKEGERLILVNSIRLGEEGLAQLDALGKVTDVVRLAGFHGMDDPFYHQRYGARISVVKGQRYTAGFDTKSPGSYFTPDAELEAGPLPLIAGARLVVIDSSPPEGVLLLEREGGILVAGDSLQNWATTDEYFNWIGKGMMRLAGFIKPCNVGPGWLKQARPPAQQVRALLDLPFEHLLPSHGAPVLGGAREHLRPAVEKVLG